MNNFKRNYLENYNDSEHAVKTKNAPFFMIFPNISFFHMVVTHWFFKLPDRMDGALDHLAIAPQTFFPLAAEMDYTNNTRLMYRVGPKKLAFLWNLFF